MLRFAEEILLLLLDEDTGGLTQIPDQLLGYVLAGPGANLFAQRHGKTHLRSRDIWKGFMAEWGLSKLIIGADDDEHFSTLDKTA